MYVIPVRSVFAVLDIVVDADDGDAKYEKITPALSVYSIYKRIQSNTRANSIVNEISFLLRAI